MNIKKSELEEFEKKLKEKGYKKYNENFKSSDYIFWKSFEVTKNPEGGRIIGYQVGIAIYDWTKYNKNICPEIGIGYEMILGHDSSVGRIDLSITDDKLSIENFEMICNDFYEFWKKRNVNN